MATKNRIQVILDAQNRTKRAFAEVDRSAKGLTKTFGNLKGAIGGLSIGAAFIAFDQFSKAAFEANRAFLEFSERLGASAGALSELKAAGDLAGVAFGQVSLAVQRATRRIGEAAKGTGEAQAALKELDLVARDLSLLSADEQFNRVADALLQVENRTERLALAFKVFDSEGTAVLQLLDDLEAGRRLARESGAVITDTEISALERYREEIAETTAATLSLQQAWVNTGIPESIENIKQAVITLAEVVVDVFGVAGKAIGATAASVAAASQLEFGRARAIWQEFAADVRDTFGDQEGAGGGGGGTFIGQLADDADKAKEKFDAITQSLRNQIEVQSLILAGNEDVAEKIKVIQQAELSLGLQRFELGKAEQEQLNALVQKQLEITAAIKARAQADKDLAQAQKDAEDAADQVLRRQQAFADNVAATMTSAFEDAIFQSGKLKDIFNGLLEDLAKIVVRTQILLPLTDTISGFIPRIGRKATGGFASGLTLVGERGPELVSLPSSSYVTPNNKLGGGVNVVVNNNTSTPADAEVQQQPDGTVMITLIESVVAESINSNGTVGKAMMGTFGTRRRAVSR